MGSVSPLPFSRKKKKLKSQTVTPTLPKSQGPKALKLLSQKRKNPLSKKAPKETKATPPPSQWRVVSNPTQSPRCTRKSQPLPKDTTTDPKDSGGNVQLADKVLPSTASNEGTAKTMLRPEGSLGDKDSGGNKLPVDMEPINHTVANPSRTGAEYQESDEEEVFAVGDGVKYLRKVSRVLFSKITQEQWAQHKEVVVSYADLKASIEGDYEENIAHRDQTNKLVEASMSSLDKIRIVISNLYTGLNIITKLLKDIKNVVKDDPVLNKKVIEATMVYTKNSSSLTELLNLHLASWAKSSNSLAWNLGLKMTAVKSSQAEIKSDISSLKQDTSEIKSMMTEIFIPSKNVIHGGTKEASSHTEGEHVSMKDDKADEEPTREITLIESSSKPPLTDPTLEILEDSDEPIRVPYMINGKMHYLTDDEINAYLVKEDKIKKAVKEAKMLEMTRTEVIKVVQEEAKKIRLDPKIIKSGKAGRKRKHMELEPKIKVPGLECNKSLPEGVQFVNNMVIEEPEYGIFFTDVHAFWSLNEDILEITSLTTNTPYPSRKIQRICACTHQRQRPHDQYAVSSEDQYAVLEIMDDPNITMEEYIRLEEEKAQNRGKVFNWETTKYGKIWYDEDVYDLRSIENEFPTIAFNDSLKSGETLSCEPTVPR
ncbi:hypothetical protein Tco_1109471 [Tanacetum coccineum]